MTQTKTPHMTDYEAECRNFHLDVPEKFNFAIDVIDKWLMATLGAYWSLADNGRQEISHT